MQLVFAKTIHGRRLGSINQDIVSIACTPPISDLMTNDKKTRIFTLKKVFNSQWSNRTKLNSQVFQTVYISFCLMCKGGDGDSEN